MGSADPKPDRAALWPEHRDSLILAGNSPLTIRDRRRTLAALTRGSNVDLADIQASHVRALLAKGNLSAATRACYLSHVRSFYTWCIFNDLLTVDPCAKLSRIKVRQGLPRPISHADLQRALDAAPANVRAWLMLGAYAGLRCAEAATLRRDSIRDGVLIVTGKGGKTRAVPIHPQLAAELEQWPAEGYLFPGAIDGHVSPKTVSSAIGQHLTRCGINATAHATRHRFGTDIYRVSQDVRATQVLLGHSSVATTQVYTEVDQPALEIMVAALDYGLAKISTDNP